MMVVSKSNMNVGALLVLWLSTMMMKVVSPFLIRPPAILRHQLTRLKMSDSNNRLEYQHGYHAGNYADVVKHSVLIMLLEHMKKKKSPFVYVDTHAGAGSYPLESKEALQMGEFEQGIGRLLEIDEELPPSLSKLVGITKKSDSLIYPGSPMIAKEACRNQDSFLLFEKARDQFDLLLDKVDFEGTQVFNDDGYQGLSDYAYTTSNLPRSLVFVDPPYQYGSDNEQAARLVKVLSRHWRSARVALWYPASKDLTEKTSRLLSLMKDASDADVLALEMYPNDAIGTGMVLVNPPYGIEEDLREALPQIAQLLREEKPSMRMKWL